MILTNINVAAAEIFVLKSDKCIFSPAVLCGRHPEEMETLVFLFSFSALGILYAMNTIPELQEWVNSAYFILSADHDVVIDRSEMQKG